MCYYYWRCWCATVAAHPRHTQQKRGSKSSAPQQQNNQSPFNESLRSRSALKSLAQGRHAREANRLFFLYFFFGFNSPETISSGSSLRWRGTASISNPSRVGRRPRRRGRSLASVNERNDGTSPALTRRHDHSRNPNYVCLFACVYVCVCTWDGFTWDEHGDETGGRHGDPRYNWPTRVPTARPL